MEAAFQLPDNGALIAFCGLDGCGKTTQLRLLAARLGATRTVHCTRQPTTAFRADPVMRAYIDARPDAPDPVEVLPEIALLAAADRFRHLRTEVMPHLRAGEIVLSDRYVFTCFAYSKARGFHDLPWVEQLNKFTPMPDLTLYIDVPPEVALERIMMRGDLPRREELQADKMAMVREAFLTQPWGRVDGYHVLDGTQPPEELAAQVAALADEMLARKGIAARATLV